jgi:MFS transporter, FHS family, glucose/mannose:H+ symporter
MARTRLILAIALSYVIFAVLLNSVGTVILQSIEFFRVDKLTASTLEGFKDIPIAITSFLVASQLPRFGLKRGMMAGLALAGCACLAMPLVPSFWTSRLMFLAVGVGFAVTKVSVYAFVGLLTKDSAGHAGLLNTIEGVFMIGVLGGYWLFSAFIDPVHAANPSWLRVYYVLAGACAVAIALLASVKFEESGTQPQAAHDAAGEFAAMLALIAKLLTLVFVGAVFLYVLVEQGVGSWLPTFNRELLGLSAQMSVQAASVFAASLALGRLGAGVIVRKTGWFWLLIGCLIAMALLILIALPLVGGVHRQIQSWSDAPLAVFVLPLIGLVMAPIYPALNSAILSAMPKHKQPSMIGLIVVFSALGGTTGSIIVGRTFEALGGTIAFYLLLGPIACLLLLVILLQRLTAARAQEAQNSKQAA